MFIVYYLTNGNLNYCISSDEFCEDSTTRQLSTSSSSPHKEDAAGTVVTRRLRSGGAQTATREP